MNNLLFKEWLSIIESAMPVHSILKKNPNHPDNPIYDFMVLLGNTGHLIPQIKKDGPLGGYFKYFGSQKVWNIPRFVFSKLEPEMRKAFEDLGINFIPFEQPREIALGEKAEVSVDQKIRQEIEDINRLANAGEQNDRLINLLDKIIDEIGDLTNEAIKSDIIKNFLLMASRLYKYSPRNQWLIYAQNPKATDVQSVTNWGKLGRKLKQDAEIKNRIRIFVPVGVRLVTVKDEKTGEEKKVPSGTPTRFKLADVFDISDTEPIPGSKTTYNPHSWRQDSNEPVEELGGIINAILKFAEENLIPIKYEKMNYAMGGYANAHGIAVNDIYDGINKASTLVHEISHKLLHFGDDRQKISSEEKEHDAETIAYVFLKHFGFESKDSPTYLALWQADKSKIMMRQKKVKEIVSQLIKAVEKYYKEVDYSSMQDETED
jgi:hypothetical protein